MTDAAPGFLAAVVALSSLALFVLGRRSAARPLRAALADVATWCGLTLVLLLLNLALAVGAVLVLRHAFGVFVSMYMNADFSLLVASALQAAALLRWQGRS